MMVGVPSLVSGYSLFRLFLRYVPCVGCSSIEGGDFSEFGLEDIIE